MSPRVLARLCLAAAVVPVGGCLSPSAMFGKKKPAWTFDPPMPESRAAAPEELLQPAPPQRAASSNTAPAVDSATVEALRRKSEAYAQALELLLRERVPQPAPAAELEAPAPRGSGVQWLDPAQFRLSLGETRNAPRERHSPPPTTGNETPNEPRSVHASDAPAGVESVASRNVASRNKDAPPAAGAAFEDSNTPLALADLAEKAPSIAMITPAPGPVTGEPRPPTLALETPRDASGLLSRLTRRVKDNPRDIASHLEYQLLLFLMDEQVPDLASIATLPQEDRELVTALIDGVANLRATLRRDANLLIAEKIRPIVELSDRLRTNAELTIPTMTLCSRVDGFGRYEPMEPRFIAGRESPTIVYCEIENFSSQYEQQQWQTVLSMELSLFTEAGQQVYVEQPVQITDTSSSRRRDFFVRKVIKLPSNLTIGRYVLKVTIVDTQASRVAESSMPLQIVAK